MTPWQRFARRRLAVTRWQCEPEHIPADQQTAFDDAFARQCQLEQAVVEVTAGDPLPDSVLQSVATSLASWLDEGHFSADERQMVIRHHARMEWQFAEIAGRAPLPDDLQVLAWYQQHQAQFMRPPQRLTSHLLLTVDNDDAAVQRQIHRFHQDISVSRQHFARLTQRYSHCPSALEGGRLGWISQGLLYPELDAALFALAENGLSAPIETRLGWHLLWCEAIRDAAPMPQAEALEKARSYLVRKNQQQYQRQWLAALTRSVMAD
ncbi:nitrogen fixation protein NifM [Pantoea sp. LS15]|uniref:nitrogen fixation protein NifM n=1 Tax=Enterobacterales TaxID=91347 RepID=UPI000E0F69FA|nr:MULTISPECIES: nitrogen fixation protein NifM [Enterobacterales]NJQ18419.1 nitrogen fixation protein NifM [Pantoea sp. LS15]NKF45015.1 nitrogen fixation protein NifM [Pantoea sp. LS15]RDK16463.1 nitrogen fixation protein NifM [Enterobacter sp. 9-2]